MIIVLDRQSEMTGTTERFTRGAADERFVPFRVFPRRRASQG